ncbi:MAG: 16S rRNA (guanine(527)-N(7))-methyltransferase RsmG [Pseudomonadota bacterium]
MSKNHPADPAATLAQGIATLGLPLDAAQQERLLAYLALLVKWNQAYNLTAIRHPLEMVTKHLLDSLAVQPYLYGTRVLDVGSGAGLPGIPLAIADPAREFTLLDSNGKKTRFLLQAKGELRLSNLSVVHSRLEQYRPGQLFDTVTARAFASLADMVAGTAHLLAPGGSLLAMKGEYPQDELDALPPGFVVREIIALTVPGLEAQRHLVRIAPDV